MALDFWLMLDSVVNESEIGTNVTAAEAVETTVIAAESAGTDQSLPFALALSASA